MSSAKSRQNWSYLVWLIVKYGKVLKEDINLRLGSVVINPSEIIRRLCVILDSELTYCQNIIIICRLGVILDSKVTNSIIIRRLDVIRDSKLTNSIMIRRLGVILDSKLTNSIIICRLGVILDSELRYCQNNIIIRRLGVTLVRGLSHCQNSIIICRLGVILDSELTEPHRYFLTSVDWDNFVDLQTNLQCFGFCICYWETRLLQFRAGRTTCVCIVTFAACFLCWSSSGWWFTWRQFGWCHFQLLLVWNGLIYLQNCLNELGCFKKAMTTFLFRQAYT